MKEYAVIGSVAKISGGILALTEEQAKARIHNLKNLEDGLYQVERPVQFKRGESFGYDGGVNKRLLQEIEPTSKKLTAKELIAAILEAETVEDLIALIDTEEERKTVVEAFEKKKVELEMSGN